MKSISNSSYPIIYMIQNHTLQRIHFLMESCKEEFICFLRKLYDMMEYEYDIHPITIEEPFTIAEWRDFCQYVKKHVGTTFKISYLLNKALNSSDIISNFQEYIKAYRIHLLAHQKFHLFLFSPYSNSTSLMIEEKEKREEKREKKEENKEKEKREEKREKKEENKEENKEKEEDNETSYSVQYSDPSSEYYSLVDDWEKTPTKKTILLLDKNQMITMVIQEEDCQWVEILVKYFEEYIILKEHTNLPVFIEESLCSFFQMRQFIDESDAQRKLKIYEILHDLVNKTDSTSTSLSTLEQKIHGYLSANYEISGDSKKTMRASVLQKRIESALMGTEIGIMKIMTDTVKFGKTVSGVLLNMGLKKKRMSDGIYYYGIEPRDAKEKIMATELDSILSKNEKSEK